MIFFIILLIVTLIIGGWIGYESGWGNFEDTFIGVLLAFTLYAGCFVILQMIGAVISTTTKEVTYPVPIVTLNDGKGMKGRISGGMFVIRGSFEDTQHFSYYRKEADGSFLLEKRPATASKIWLDATAETARVDITDTVYGCEPKHWWVVWGCGDGRPATFVRADFHIPADSIVNEFELDAE